MALTPSKLQKIAGGSKQVFTYETADAIGTVKGSGYFNAVTTNLKQYDIITTVSSVGGTPAVTDVLVTSATGAATVTTV